MAVSSWREGRDCLWPSVMARTLLCIALLTLAVAASSGQRRDGAHAKTRPHCTKGSCELPDQVEWSPGEPDSFSDGSATVVTHHGAALTPKTNPDDANKEQHEEGGDMVVLVDGEQGDDNDDVVVVDDDGEVGRAKRYSISDYYVWPKGIVPYDLMDNLGDHYRPEALASMALFEKYTCIRFVPWVAGETMQKYGLTEESHVNIEKRGNQYHDFYCVAVLGNAHVANGQWNSCCNRTTCMHELGHTLGMHHEHQNPLRSDYVEVKRNRVKIDGKAMFRVDWLPPYIHQSVMDQYDMSSTMHYGVTTFRTLYEEMKPLVSIRNLYYLFKDATLYTRCWEHHCSNFTGQCHNDGFLTLVDDQCSCLCPPGLDPATGCATTISQADASVTWPAEAFAMFAPLSGCPDTSVFDTGSWQHKGAGSNQKSAEFHLAGSYESDVFRYSFCVKGQTSGATATTWDSGRYCFLRAGGSCPEGFQTGHIQFDDADDSQGQAEGQLPDGVFVNGTDTRLEFCCRDDGFTSTPLSTLPNTQPLTLLQTPQGRSCQEVAGMAWTEEYMWFKSLLVTPSLGGLHPRVSDTYKLYFCHYQPINLDCGGTISLTASSPQAVITSPNYPLAYDANTECNWLITAEDPGSKVLLNFQDFRLTTVPNGCQDTLEIRYNLPGQPGLRYCGDGIGRTIRSIKNIVILTLRADHNKVTSDVGFNVTVSLDAADASCYDPSSKGVYYRGPKNYTRGMKPCLAWTEASSCRHHAMHPRDFAKGLDENFCRNPDNTAMPWCYTTPSCDRDYCDVCNVERMYDRSANCYDGLCNKSVEVIVKAGCAGTCGLQHPTKPVRDTQCGEPEVPSDATMVDPQSFTGPAPVGSTVSLRCHSGTETFTLTCLSDGTWTRAGFVCGACSDGWAFYNGSCYRYFALQKEFEEAREVCAGYDAIVAPMRNAHEMEFVSTLRLHLFPMWIGATDLAVEGQWVWEDGTEVTWSHWTQGGPGSHDCVIADVEVADTAWRDSSCTWYRFPFVCTYNVSERSICVDRRPDCVATLTTRPSLCSQSPDYADQLCAYTCGRCQPDATTPCDVPATSSDVVLVSPQGGGSVARGQEVTYACAEGLVLDSGLLTQACGADGNLIGSSPVCKDPDYVTQDSNDLELTPRMFAPWSGHVYAGVGSRLVVSRRGVVKQWKFYSDHRGYVFFQVWRRPLGSDTSLTFVDQNPVLSDGTGEQTADLLQADWISVQPGDVLALMEMWSLRAKVTYDPCSAEGLDGLMSSGYPMSAEFSVSENITFDRLSCREFSFKAVIYPVDSIPDLPDVATSQEALHDRWWVAEDAYLGDSPDFRIPATGRVTRWQFFAKYGGLGAFQVWRKRFEQGTGKFELIGQTKVNISSDEADVYTIDAGNIAVEEGDLIGFMYAPSNRLGLPDQACRTNYTDSNNIYRLRYVSPDSAQIGVVYTFSNRHTCLTFSFRAIVEQHPTEAPTEVLTSHTALVSRTKVPKGGRAFLGNSTGFRVPVKGSVKEWQFFSIHAGTGHFQIWRPTQEFGKFQFIGQNFYNLTSQEAGVYTYPVPVGERIAVEAGDLTAFWYADQNRLGVPFSFCSGEHELENYGNSARLTPSGLVPGAVHVFQYLSNEFACRVFSFRALIQLSP